MKCVIDFVRDETRERSKERKWCSEVIRIRRRHNYVYQQKNNDDIYEYQFPVAKENYYQFNF